MSGAPYLLLKARTGYRMGHGELLDHMFWDGLQNAYDGKAMAFSPMRPRPSTASAVPIRMLTPPNPCGVHWPLVMAERLRRRSRR